MTAWNCGDNAIGTLTSSGDLRTVDRSVRKMRLVPAQPPGHGIGVDNRS